MPRKTKRTIRRLPPLTRALLKVANDLDKANRRLLKIAEQVADAEYAAQHYEALLTRFSKDEESA